MASLRIVFMGTPDFALPALAALAEAGHGILAVYCQPPRPAGRGHKPRPAPVERFAAARGWPVRHPKSLRDKDEQAAFAALGADLGVVAAYGLILPPAVLQAPRHGCLNIHASLLPRWRGAAPIQRALLAGDDATGITIMQMDEGLDTGDILLQRETPIGPDETGQSLHDRLADLGAALIVEAAAAIADGRPPAPRPQDPGPACYAAKVEKHEGRLDWRRPAVELERQVRAFFPFPGAWCEVGGERIKVRRAEIALGEGSPGQVLDDRLTVACGSGALRLLEVQRGGKAAMAAEAFLRGFALAKGSELP